MEEGEATGICMACFNQFKNKPVNLLLFAIACRTLLKLWGIKEMSKYFRVSEYQIRQIDKINDLNPKLKKLASTKNSGIEVFYHLWRLKEPKRTEAAKIIKDMNSVDIRTLVYFIQNNPDLSVAECKKLVVKSKPEQVNLLILPLDQNTYEKLKQSAHKSEMKLHDYAIKKLGGRINVKTE